LKPGMSMPSTFSPNSSEALDVIVSAHPGGQRGWGVATGLLRLGCYDWVVTTGLLRLGCYDWGVRARAGPSLTSTLEGWKT
jgi:hypothetical protein